MEHKMPNGLDLLSLLFWLAEHPGVHDLEEQSFKGSLPEPPHFPINVPGTVIKNGSLHLPPGAFVSVEADNVTLCDLTITGQGSPQGLLCIKGKNVSIEDVKIKMKPDDDDLPHGDSIGLYVRGGGVVQALSCKVAGAGSHGFMVEDVGSRLVCERCTSTDNAGCGFAVGTGGFLEIKAGCRAKENKQHGYFACGAGAWLITTSETTADENGQSGFAAGVGGLVEVAAASTAKDNSGQGFFACGAGARLVTREGCAAMENVGSGFAAWEGGLLEVGPSACAKDNQQHGYFAVANGKLTTHPGCIADDNTGSGFAAADNGVMEVGAGAKAKENNDHGYVACGVGAKLVTGEGCLADDNKGLGFTAAAGGALATGANCVADGDVARRFAAAEGGSISVGAGCNNA